MPTTMPIATATALKQLHQQLAKIKTRQIILDNIHHTLHLDFETCSEVDLRACGLAVYARHPSTKVLCLSARMGSWSMTWTLKPGEPLKPELIDLIDLVQNGKAVHAWNATFEWVIWNEVFQPFLARAGLVYTSKLKLPQMRCTMALAAYCGYPQALDAACRALQLPAGLAKDMAGHRLMMTMCRPRANGNGWWHEHPTEGEAKLKSLTGYCAQDTIAEEAVLDRLPIKELPGTEQVLWELTQIINERGMLLDTDLVQDMTHYAIGASAKCDNTIKLLTGGAVQKWTQLERIKNWLANVLPDVVDAKDTLDKAALEELLDDLGEVMVDSDDPGNEDPNSIVTSMEWAARQVIRTRLVAAKTSVSKLNSMLRVADVTDNRARGLFRYYGASRTGRWAGSLIQVQNMPRSKIVSPDNSIMLMKAMIDSDMIARVEGEPIQTVLSSCLRGCFVARPGHRFVVVDFSSIEARVLAWLANATWKLRAFAEKKDLYITAAAQVYSVAEDQVTPDQRQVGKVAELACGFQGGWRAFMKMAKLYGVKNLREDTADNIVQIWRHANQEIVQLWHATEHMVRTVITTKGPAAAECFNAYALARKLSSDLELLMPSRRRGLRYPDMQLGYDSERQRPQLSYMGINQYTRQWERIDTFGGKLVENMVQAMARDLLASAMLTMESNGINIVGHVHDEVIAEVPIVDAEDTLNIMLAIMRKTPAWCPGLPLDAAGKIVKRYGK